MQLVIIKLHNGAQFEMHPTNLKVYPSGDLEYKQATHGSVMGRVYGRNKRGMIGAKEIKSTAFY